VAGEKRRLSREREEGVKEGEEYTSGGLENRCITGSVKADGSLSGINEQAKAIILRHL